MGAALHRRVHLLELLICTVVVTGIGVFGLWKMDYLQSATAHHVRMTDNSRSAYVAKNIVDGNGYTTKELPAFLLDFYDQRGKLHAEQWANADRFPFTTWAIAGLYTVTGTTSWRVGILGYNLICFVAFLVLLYWLARSVWNDRWAALATLGVAMLHPLAYVYPLYMKDADMLFLTTGVIAGFYRCFSSPPDKWSWKLMAAMGTMLAWLFLARPNIGGGFIACFGVLALHRLWGLRRELGLGGALRAVLRREGIATIVVIAWCLPFLIHSLAEWGTPFFSANAIYQRPLGTRFAMETDTWFKYSEPGVDASLGFLAEHAPGQLMSKFTSSWIMTIRSILGSFALELILALGLFRWVSTRPKQPAAPAADAAEAEAEAPIDYTRERAVLKVAKLVGIVVLLNFLLLPLYGYQNYAYRHYLSFFLPLLWLTCGRAIVLLVEFVRPAASKVFERVRARPALVLLVILAALLVWNFGPRAQTEHQLFTRTAKFIGKHWLTSLTVLVVFLAQGWLRRAPRFLLAAGLTCGMIMGRFEPFYEIKSNNLNWFPTDQAVWKVLKERSGLVMSFALQSEVNWATDRKNIPAPELMMHVYSFLFDHQLEVEDVYIESAAAMIGPEDGPFYGTAPGFESYARMQKFKGRLPGYELVFSNATMRAYPKYRIRKARPKASSVYRLVDREAVRAMGQSPARIELGSVDNVVYTAHGWGNYFTFDGRPAVAAVDSTRERLGDRADGLRPYEDTSATFFLDDRRPTSIDIDIFATRATTLEFFWNLDLYAYDRPADRRGHRLGTYAVTERGWQRVHLEIPAGLTRKGINKVGFRTAAFHPVTVCPASFDQAACALIKDDPDDDVLALSDATIHEPVAMYASVFVGTLELHYPADSTATPK